MGLGKSHKQALCAGSFSGILLLRSLCKRLNCCCLCHWMKSCRGTSEQNILSVSANAGTQPSHSGPAQRRVYGSECYKNGFVCSLQQRCSGQVHLRLKGEQLFRGRWYMWGWRWGTALLWNQEPKPSFWDVQHKCAHFQGQKVQCPCQTR